MGRLQGLNGVAGSGSSTDPAFDADPDKDGIKNGLEWLLGGDPKVANPLIAPTYSHAANGDLTLVFKRVKTSISEVTITLQYGASPGALAASMAIPDAVGTGPVGNNTVTVADLDADYQQISVTISHLNAADGKLFGRVHVTQP